MSAEPVVPVDDDLVVDNAMVEAAVVEEAALDAALDVALAAREAALPGLHVVLDDAVLRQWADRRGLRLPAGARVDRVRIKPGTSARAALDPGDGGEWWLLHAFSPRSWPKHGKDLPGAGGHRGGYLVDAELRLVAVPAESDRRLRPLPRLRPDSGLRVRRTDDLRRLLRYVAPDRDVRRSLIAGTVSHNPVRRWVGTLTADGAAEPAGLLKLHRHQGTARRAVRAATLLSSAGIRVADHGPVSTTGTAGITTWVPGRHPGPADDGAVQQLLADLGDLRVEGCRGLPDASGAVVDAGLPVLDAGRLADAVTAAVAAVAAVDPGRGARASALRDRWLLASGAAGTEPHPALRPRVVVHGDLGPDQVVVDSCGPVLLDLDRAAVGPAGWDAAGWFAAVLADPSCLTGHRPGPAVHPLVLAAAVLLRSPEPWRRRRPGRTRALDQLLDAAETALCHPASGPSSSPSPRQP